MMTTKSFRKSKKKEKYERVQVSQSFQTVLQRSATPTDQGRMLMFLRQEFPMAFERFLMDNGGRLPHIPISFPLYSSVSNHDIECKDAESLDAITIETETAMSSVMCTMPVMTSREIPPENVTKAVATDIWSLLSGIFCFSGSSQYMPDDSEYIVFDGNMSDNDMPDIPAPPVVTTKKPKSLVSRLNPMKMLGPLTSSPSYIAARNPLLFQHRSTDYQNNRELLAQDLSDEAIRILKLYVGLSRETGVSFNWALKISKNNIFVHNCDIPGSSFSALKSDCTVKKDKYTILRYLTDDERSKEYDETLEGYKLLEIVDDRTRIRRYFYKGIWPCSARDFILLTTWKELDDGSILVATISPPDEFYPDNDGFVRASILISGAHIRPIDANLGGGCAITVIGHSDLKGNVPSLVINQLSSSIPYKFMKKFKESVEKVR